MARRGPYTFCWCIDLTEAKQLYAIYRDPFGPPLDVGESLAADLGMHNAAATACPNFAFAMERSACALFGVVTYGAHMNAFEPDARGAPARIWIPRRAANKSTYAIDSEDFLPFSKP
jgi:hypothetical protein